MKPTIVFSYVTEGATISYSHAIAALAGELGRAGWAPNELRVVRLAGSVPHFVDRIMQNDPAIVLFSTMSNQWHRIRAVAHDIRQTSPTTMIGIGGPHVLADTPSVISSEFDFAVVGEADQLIVALVEDIVTLPTRPITTRIIDGIAPPHLDALARPAIELFQVADILSYPSLMFSRGCPYRCNYCMSRNGGQARRVRWKSPRRAVSEVLDILAYASPDHLNFDDDTLLKNPRWLREFTAIYGSEVGIPFHCNARPETVTPELTRLLATAGCSAIGIGIESGSERIRREILGRPMTDDQIVRAFQTAQSAGLKTWSFIMIGLPTESVGDLESTISLNARCDPDYVRVSIYTAYPGSPLGDSLYYADAAGESTYLRSPGTLPDDMRTIATHWLSDLIDAGKLWYTESELLGILTNMHERHANTLEGP